MPKPRSGHVRRRNIALKIKTYERLEQFLLELMKEQGTTKLTFDDAVSALLDEHYGRKRGGEKGA